MWRRRTIANGRDRPIGSGKNRTQPMFHLRYQHLVNLDCDDRSRGGLQNAERLPRITKRFASTAPKGSHVKKRESWSPRLHDGAVTTLSQASEKCESGERLSHPSDSILPSLCFSNTDTGNDRHFYRGHVYSGVGSSRTVPRREPLETDETLRVIRAGAGVFKKCNRYSTHIRRIGVSANGGDGTCVRETQIDLREIALEAERDGQERPLVPVTTLSTRWSVNK